MEPQKITLIDALLPKIENKILVFLKDIVLVLGFTLLTAIFAKVKVEVGPVPITGQTFIVLLAGVLLGSKRAAFSQIFYLLGGVLGIPWFARGGGISYLTSPTFGYIIGFAAAAFFVGFLVERGWGNRFEKAMGTMIIGNFLIYLPGLLWLSRFVGWEKVLSVGFYPFIVGDIIKSLLVVCMLLFGWRFVKIKK